MIQAHYIVPTLSMCVQPGDWVCSSCGFVNWRRRRVCMRCFPFADTNEMSHSIASGALVAAQLAAGLEPSQEALTSLAQPRRSKTEAYPPSSNVAYKSASFPLSLPSRTDFLEDAFSSHQNSLRQSDNVNADLFECRNQLEQERFNNDEEREVAEIMNRTLSLRACLSNPTTTLISSNKASSHSNNTGYQGSTALLTPLSSNPLITRSPSMPVLLFNNSNVTNEQNVWIDQATNSHNARYRSYKPTTIFSSDSGLDSQSSTASVNLASVNARTQSTCSFGKQDENKLDINNQANLLSLESYNSLTDDDGVWMNQRRPISFNSSASSSTTTMESNFLQPKKDHQASGKELDKVGPSTLINKSTDTTSSRLSKFQAVIQPPISNMKTP